MLKRRIELTFTIQARMIEDRVDVLREQFVQLIGVSKLVVGSRVVLRSFGVGTHDAQYLLTRQS